MAWGFSESVVSHLVSWVSSYSVPVLFLVGGGCFVLCCLALFLVGFVLVFCGFLLSPILQYEGIADQRQNVLMTVRALSVHGMSSKKKTSNAKAKEKKQETKVNPSR